MPSEVANIQLFFGPSEFGAPDALLHPIVDTILGAREHLFVATQQLEHPDIVNALVIARRHGVTVRVLLERDYLRETQPRDQIWERGGSFEFNREVLAALYRANIDVRVERRSRLMHHNFIIADDKSDSATVVSTSANFTPHGMHRNFNHLLVIRDKRVAARFTREFESMWQDELNSPHPAKPYRFVGDELTMKAVFGPEQDPEQELVKQILGAKHSIFFSISSFSTGSAIDDALSRSSEAGIQVLGVMDRNQALQRWAATDVLDRAGILVHITEEFLPPKLHHKLMVLDEATMCIGTFNYSVSARANEEVVIVLQPHIPDSTTTLTEYAKREVLRIQHEFSQSTMRLLSG